MLIIRCPWCGERDQTEFHYGGEAGIRRPKNPQEASDQTWAEYLFYRKNLKGVHTELWVHNWGCRQWIRVTRDTVTHEIFETAPVHATAGATSPAKTDETP